MKTTSAINTKNQSRLKDLIWFDSFFRLLSNVPLSSLKVTKDIIDSLICFICSGNIFLHVTPSQPNLREHIYCLACRNHIYDLEIKYFGPIMGLLIINLNKLNYMKNVSKNSKNSRTISLNANTKIDFCTFPVAITGPSQKQ